MWSGWTIAHLRRSWWVEPADTPRAGGFCVAPTSEQAAASSCTVRCVSADQSPNPSARARGEAAPVDTVSMGAPPEKVGPWLAEQLGDRRWAHCAVTPIGDGRSNLTFQVHSAAGSVVLRRPPLGSVAATAHDMGRERTVLTALADTAVPVPAVLGGQQEPGLLGAPFYVMELVAGTVPAGDAGQVWAREPLVRHSAGAAMVDVLADLHSIDPAAVGLLEFGRPEGFMARQVRRGARSGRRGETA